MDQTNLFSGEWRIQSWVQRYDDGRVEYPMGQQLEGFIRYLPDGRMFCMIARAERSPFVEGGQWNAPPHEKARAYDSMLAYAGRYTVTENAVVHHVELALFPNWQGGTQRRRFEIDEEGTMTLSARLEEGTAEARTAVLAWRRTPTSEGQA
jgi:hypothetical protein